MLSLILSWVVTTSASELKCRAGEAPNSFVQLQGIWFVPECYADYDRAEYEGRHGINGVGLELDKSRQDWLERIQNRTFSKISWDKEINDWSKYPEIINGRYIF